MNSQQHPISNVLLHNNTTSSTHLPQLIFVYEGEDIPTHVQKE